MSSRRPRFIWLFIVVLALVVSAAVWISNQPANRQSPLPVLEHTDDKKVRDDIRSDNEQSNHEDAQKKEQLAALDDLIKNADPKRGRTLVHMCNDCHTFDEDGPNRFGPNLYGVYGRHFASKSNYPYSQAMQALKDKVWDAENLNNFLISTKEFVPGTKMVYPGVSTAENRADIIAYLKTLK